MEMLEWWQVHYKSVGVFGFNLKNFFFYLSGRKSCEKKIIFTKFLRVDMLQEKPQK